MTPSLDEQTVMRACRTLFGSSPRLGRDFLISLQPAGAKSAFRKVAKATHPDLFLAEEPQVRERQTERLREAIEAYDLLTAFFRQRENGAWMPTDAGPEPPADTPDDGRHEGMVPPRRLAIGLYLYYRRIIPYAALREALAWQRRQRPFIGAIARQWNWLDDAQIRTVLKHGGPGRRFGESAVQLGLLEPRHVTAMLWIQRSHQERLGEFFVRRGYIGRDALDRLVQEFRSHNARFDRDRPPR